MPMSLAPPYENHLMGFAIFDLSGLPKEYCTLLDSGIGITWVQSIFQVIGMRSLLSASLSLENFLYAIIQGKGCTALVIRQQNDYLAVLLRGDLGTVSDDLLGWAKQLNVKQFANDPRYKVV
jgi:hypothetical protein